jgi:hypothetical protein
VGLAFQTAEESFAEGMLQWLKKLPSEFHQLKVTIFGASEGQRQWKVSSGDDLSPVRQIVTYSNTFPPGLAGTLGPQT